MEDCASLYHFYVVSQRIWTTAHGVNIVESLTDFHNSFIFGMIDKLPIQEWVRDRGKVAGTEKSARRYISSRASSLRIASLFSIIVH